MKAGIALLGLTITAVAALGLLGAGLAYAEQPTAGTFTLLSATAERAVFLTAQGYSPGVRRGGSDAYVGRSRDGVNGNGRYFGLSPYHRDFLPYYYDSEGYYGTSNSTCDWNGYIYICDWTHNPEY
ncbi:MAG: hypothetical protein HY913_17775 [Desulfomonile tiedjei]|nr:hypothetical protein [Desulfomonile tiedjei]